MCPPPPNPNPAEYLPLPRLNSLEQNNFVAMQAELAASIQKGLGFMAAAPA